MENAKFKFVSVHGEFEIEGSENFVERNIQKLKEYIEMMSPTEYHHSKPDKSKPGIVAGKDQVNNDLNVPETFGEWMNTFKNKTLNDLDKALITAYFIQKKSSTNEFKTNELSTVLLEHGIKLANPSNTLKRLSDKKYMFQVRKDGKVQYKRVSEDGEKKLKELLIGE